jgi:hypothetical protein
MLGAAARFFPFKSLPRAFVLVGGGQHRNQFVFLRKG